MAESKIPVGSTGEDLRTVEQTTSAGTVHTEAVFIADPVDVDQRATVTDTTPAADASALVVRQVGTLPVSGTVTANTGLSQPLTDAQLRAVAVPVSGTFFQATQPVSGPLTDAQLRASDVPVSGPLTDDELRATPVPVSGTVTANTGLTQPLTDAQLRATPPEVAEADLTITVPNAVTVGSTSSTIVASATSGERDILISVPTTADTGIHVNVGAAATTSKFLIQSGGRLVLNTNQAVHAIRAGSADVTAYLITGVPA